MNIIIFLLTHLNNAWCMGQCPTPFCFLNSKSSWCKIERLEEVVFGLFINQKCVSGVT